jgi:hypothetical protein
MYFQLEVLSCRVSPRVNLAEKAENHYLTSYPEWLAYVIPD